MIVCPIVGPTFQEAAQAIEAGQEADFFEFRLNLPLEEQRRLAAIAKKQLVIPIKTEQDWKKLALRPAWVDLDYAERHRAAEIKGSKVIISFHDFEKTPHDLPKRPKGADKFKIACLTKGIADTLRLTALQYKDWGKTVAIAMGERGEASRVWTSWSYAPSLASQASAPGQILLNTLRNDYRIHLRGPTSDLYALIGDPVSKSISHRTHNALFEKLDIDALYLKYAVSQEELPHFLKEFRQFPFKGLSVTMPLKEAILPYLDELDPAAKAIGSINTVVVGKKLKGYNTDGPGAIEALQERIALKGKHMVILGRGGTARAIKWEAEQLGCKVTLMGRNPPRMTYDILVNATPVGMNPEEMPVDASYILPETVVFDCVRGDTAFLKAAAQKNCQLITGHELFINQAARQFAIWLNPDKCL